MIPSQITLQHGEVFTGSSPPWQEGFFWGEVVFTTGMTGYVESLTDPSFFGQILVFTHPLIGNYGFPDAPLWESASSHVAGVVLHELSPFYAHREGSSSLLDWLRAQRVPLITGVDTRALTQCLRHYGVCLGAIGPRGKQPGAVGELVAAPVESVSIHTPRSYGKGSKRIIAVDCGMKENILRSLLKFPVEVVRVPFNYDYSDESWDGLFLSNGPGDPSLCVETTAILRKALQKKRPIFGICLGTQLLAHAIGAKTYKLKYGHRGHNQPCIEESSQRCFLTSQNHGWAVDAATLPSDWEVSFRNLNDSSVEGIAHRTLPYSAVQFHPEAAPGPVDTEWLFERFYETL